MSTLQSIGLLGCFVMSLVAVFFREHRWPQVLILIFCVLALAACGGGTEAPPDDNTRDSEWPAACRQKPEVCR